MPEVTAILSLPYIQPSQAQKHVTHNEALRVLDAIIQLAVTDRNLTSPPASPSIGARYIVAAGATSDWAGKDGQIAWWDEGGWSFVAPQAGWRTHVISEARDVIYDAASGAWLDSDSFAFSATQIGINANADTTNRLSLSAPATLLNHEGAGHQLKINKASAADTASLLFQDGFSGRAEMGLAGDDDFHLKVSPDGSSWTEALIIDRNSGHFGGAAVQANATDVTAGRLARADYAYSPGNLLGTAAQTAGVPTGAVIERGSNANGEYTRYADGTQICHYLHTVHYAASSKLAALWTYPAAFSAEPALCAAIDAGSHYANASPNLGKISFAGFDVPGSTSALAVIFSDGAYYSSGGSCKVWVSATGRWY